MTLQYHLDFHRHYDHLVSVQMTFVCPHNQPTLWLPTWTAGSYLIREFAKHIAQVSYVVEGQSHLAQKISKNSFILPHATQGQTLMVWYEVYCHDLSVRTAFVDNRRIFGNFGALLLMVSSLEKSACQIRLCVPNSFLKDNPNATLAIGLKHHTTHTDDGICHVLEDIGAFESYDYPFEIGTQTYFEFDVLSANTPICHRFFIAGSHDTHINRLSADVQKICQCYVDTLGGVPFDDYTFMTMATGDGYGGLEHLNSTALITPRTDLPSLLEGDEPSANYRRFLGLCSHEYFHAWWVKSVCPDVMMDNDLTTESYTPLLWVFEGFTSYIDDLMLLKSGVISQDSYLILLQDQINRLYKTDGRHHQSVAESSFDTWIKLYRPDENTQNQSISYYNKGALVALCLDILLMQVGRRLFDVIGYFYDKSRHTPNKRYALSSDELGSLLSSWLGLEVWQGFYDDYIIGTKPLPLTELLSKIGISAKVSAKHKIWGMTLKDDPLGLKISHLHRNSTASISGLSFGDVIIAIDGIKASKDGLERKVALAKITGADVIVHAFRRDELLTFTIKPYDETSHDEYVLSAVHQILL